MGYLKEQFGITMLKKIPDGTCPICAVKHEPEMPHNRNSLVYQYNFFDEHGRFPTWADTMAHCPDMIKKLWIKELKKYGIEVENASETR